MPHLRPALPPSLASLLAPTVLGLAALVACCTPAVRGAEVAPAVAASAEQIAELIRGLDDASFSTRQKSAERLQSLAADGQQASLLAEQFERALLDVATSVEVRTRLTELRRALPRPSQPAAAEATPAELTRLVDDLNDDSFAVRSSSLERLQIQLRNPRAAGGLMVEVKRALADPELPNASRKNLVAIWEELRGRWLLSEPQWELPAVDEQQWRQWISELNAIGSERRDRLKRLAARRELLQLLAQPKYTDAVKAALIEQLDKTTEATPKRRLERLIDWTRPSMVAEIWSGGHNITIQHLLIDVPQFPQVAGAVRATHFDRIDDRVAHCVSGNTLSPGDYPVGVGIPHPNGLPALFHLINLPTVRQRLAYKYQAQRPESLRLRQISDQTLSSTLKGERRLNEAELIMLRQLDPQAVSKFAGPYFEQTKDQPLRGANMPPLGQGSEHRTLCAILQEIGTHEAVPALEKLATSSELGTPSNEAPYPIAWIAALAIAGRERWPEQDAWLAGLVDRDTELSIGTDNVPELGATAAAQLLEKHQQTPARFGLVEAPEDLLRGAGITPYRFGNPQSRAKVRAWWLQLQAETAENRSG